MAIKINPCLLYTKDAAKAARYYVSIFKDGKILASDKMCTLFRTGGTKFMALNGPAQKFTLNVSFMIPCKTQKEIEYFTKRLTKGGKQLPCGWVEDKYGMAWQVYPTIIHKLFGAKDRTKANRAFQCMITMKKFDIAKLKAAYNG